MIIKKSKIDKADASEHNDDSDLHKDEVGENTGEDTGLAMAASDSKRATEREEKPSPKSENL